MNSLLKISFNVVSFFICASCLTATTNAQESPDFMRKLQFQAVETNSADWAHWGTRRSRYSGWTNHSNRLVPVYTFGIGLEKFTGENSAYRDAKKLTAIYDRVPTESLNPDAEYFDQTDIFRLQQQAFAAGKKNVILMIFDGMDWQTTQAAAIYKHKRVVYTEGRGTGLAFLDYGGDQSGFGFCVTAPYNNDPKTDINSQTVTASDEGGRTGGYSAMYGGATPWSKPGDADYLLGQRKSIPHLVTDSASSATSLCSGAKTYNAAINVGPTGKQLEPIARTKQRDGLAIGVVTSVPISHATPACAYSNNVSRNDYQDLSRDLLGLKSVAHREAALPGVDVLIGCGWGEESDDDRNGQGQNYIPGNKYLSARDMKAIAIENGGKYVIAERTKGQRGNEVLADAVEQAMENQQRLFGFFGTTGGHVPYQTADGRFDPTRGVKTAERYSKSDISENPTLAEMSTAALKVLGQNPKGFWLMVEAGDVDWANHNNNLDDSIGAVLSGEAAFVAITRWVEQNSNWDETALIVTSDHGHLLFVDDLEALTGKVMKPAVQQSETE